MARGWHKGELQKRGIKVSRFFAVFEENVRRLGAPPTIKHVKSPHIIPSSLDFKYCRYVLPRLIIDWILIKAVTSMRTSSPDPRRMCIVRAHRFPIARTANSIFVTVLPGGTWEEHRNKSSVNSLVEFSMRSVRGISKALCIIRPTKREFETVSTRVSRSPRTYFTSTFSPRVHLPSSPRACLSVRRQWISRMDVRSCEWFVEYSNVSITMTSLRSHIAV